jgi:polysaccharide biosynthesis protein PslH
MKKDSSTKKSILFITPYFPSEYSGHAGAQLIFRNLLTLSENYNIYLISFINFNELAFVDKLKENRINISYVIFNRNSKKYSTNMFNFIKYMPRLLESFLLFKPFFLTKYKNKKLTRVVDEIIKNNKIDIIQIEYNIMHHYLPKNDNIKSVLMLHDVSTKLYERSYQQNKKIFIKMFRYIDYLKWKTIEPNILNKFDKVITLTKEDKYYIEKSVKYPISIIPPQIQFEECRIISPKKMNIIFIGSYNREPNIKALEILLFKIFPKIQFEHSNLTLTIIGKYLPLYLQKNIDKNDNIIHKGFVKDVNSEISNALLMIAPIFIGAGLKMKIPHVLSCGVPVITTSIGAEGIEVDGDSGLWVENDINKMILLSIKLLNDKKNLIEKGVRGKERVNKLFSSKVIKEKLISVYDKLLNR